MDEERLPALRPARADRGHASWREPVFVVFNPRSGKGRGAQFIQPVLEHLTPAEKLEHGLTQAPGDEARLATEAIARGFRRIVAVGGDGTWSNVGNAILRSGVPARAGARAGRHRLRPRQDARHPAARRRGLLPDRRWTATRARSTWAGSRTATSSTSPASATTSRCSRTRGTCPYLEGSALYLYCALRQLGSYRGFKVEVEADGRARARARDDDADRGERARSSAAASRSRPQRRPGGRQARRRGLRQHGPRRAASRRWCGCCAARTRHTRRSRRSRRRGSCAASTSPPDLRDRRRVEPRAPPRELVIETLPSALSVLVPAA